MYFKRSAFMLALAVGLSPLLLAVEPPARCNPAMILRMTPTGEFHEYRVSGQSGRENSIVSGPDGALWFTEWCGKIGRLAPSGGVMEYPMPAGRVPQAITVGPDGAIWFTEFGKIGRITTSGNISEFVLPAGHDAGPNIVSGSDGNLWFISGQGHTVGRMTTSGAYTEYFVSHKKNQYGQLSENVVAITAGPDGALWLTGAAEATAHTPYVSSLIRMTTAGKVSKFRLPSGLLVPFSIAAGSDGALWFPAGGVGTISRSVFEKIGRMTTAGAYSEFTLPTGGLRPAAIFASPGALWFTEYIPERGSSLTRQIGRLTIDGNFTEFRLPPARNVTGVAMGTDGALWLAAAPPD